MFQFQEGFSSFGNDHRNKMRVGVLFVFLLSAVFVSQSEGGWLKDTVIKAVDWVNENCEISDVSSWSCSYSWKRGLGRNSQQTLDRACQQIEGDSYAWDEGISMELVTDIFQEVDRNADGILSDQEYTTFMEAMEVFKHCSSE